MNSFTTGPAHLEFLKKLSLGTLRSNDEMMSEIKSLHIHDELSRVQATRLICELLTKLSYTFYLEMFGPSNWRNDLLSKPYSNGLMCRLTSPLEMFVFELYEENFGSTRETILFLDQQRDPHIVPYLHVILQNAASNILKIEGAPQTEDIKKLFTHNKLLLNWCKDKIERGFQLKHFGGQTNTRPGLYVQLFRQIPELKNFLNPDAESNIDLGGGFSTPELSQGFGIKFTSYDLISPRMALEWNLKFSPTISETEEKDHFGLLVNQPYIEFDVFTDEFPTDFESYNITSFGFINSTVTSLSLAQEEIERELKKFNSMFYGVYRIVQLIALGKSVNVVFYGRPDLAYMNRLVMMRAHQGQIEDIRIPKHFLAHQPFSQPSYFCPKISRDQIVACIGGVF